MSSHAPLSSVLWAPPSDVPHHGAHRCTPSFYVWARSWSRPLPSPPGKAGEGRRGAGGGGGFIGRPRLGRATRIGRWWRRKGGACRRSGKDRGSSAGGDGGSGDAGGSGSGEHPLEARTQERCRRCLRQQPSSVLRCRRDSVACLLLAGSRSLCSGGPRRQPVRFLQGARSLLSPSPDLVIFLGQYYCPSLEDCSMIIHTDCFGSLLIKYGGNRSSSIRGISWWEPRGARATWRAGWRPILQRRMGLCRRVLLNLR